MRDVRVREAHGGEELLVQGVEELLGTLANQVVDVFRALLVDKGA